MPSVVLAGMRMRVQLPSPPRPPDVPRPPYTYLRSSHPQPVSLSSLKLNMSRKTVEKAPLVADEEDQIMNTLRYSATNGNMTIQEGASAILVNPKREAHEVNRHSTHSDTDQENASLLGSIVQPQDLQELMANLEKATVLVRRYLKDNPEVTFGARRYVGP